MQIAVDLMGGDHGPVELLPAIGRCLQEFPDVALVLVGDAKLIENGLRNQPGVRDRVSILHADQVVEIGRAHV